MKNSFKSIDNKLLSLMTNWKCYDVTSSIKFIKNENNFENEIDNKLLHLMTNW